MGSVALNSSKEKDRSSRLVSRDLQWEKGRRQAPARKAPKGKRKKTKRRKDGDGRDAGESDERKAGGVGGGLGRDLISPRSDVWGRQPRIHGHVFAVSK